MSTKVLTARELGKVSSDGVVYAAAPQERGAYAVATRDGLYNYGYNTGDGIAKVELGRPGGSVVGSYRYFDPNGKQVLRSYIADENGFRVMGNDLPISPDTPASQIPGSPAFTAAVEGTGEFAIPPPLNSQSTEPQTSNVQLQQQLPSSQPQLQQEVTSNKLQFQQQLQSHQEEYQRQLQQLEEQRRQLQIQQAKLDALQRELESQQLKIQQQFQVQKFQFQPQQQQQQQQQQHRPVQPFHAPVQHQAQQQPQYLQLPNQLTGGITSPYYYFQHDLNYDFPAGFAYTGMPTLRSSTSQRPRYPQASYIIGQAR